MLVMKDVGHSANVIWRLDIAFHQSADIFSTKLGHEVAMLKYNILSSAILWRSVSFMASTALIAWRIEDKCKIGIVSISLYFFDDRHACVGLFVQYDRFKTEVFDKPTDLNSREIISSVNDEYFPLVPGNNWRRSKKWSCS